MRGGKSRVRNDHRVWLSFTCDYYNEIKYDMLTLTAATPTAGSIYAKWGITANGIPAASQAYEGTVTYP